MNKVSNESMLLLLLLLLLRLTLLLLVRSLQVAKYLKIKNKLCP